LDPAGKVAHRDRRGRPRSRAAPLVRARPDGPPPPPVRRAPLPPGNRVDCCESRTWPGLGFDWPPALNCAIAPLKPAGPVASRFLSSTGTACAAASSLEGSALAVPVPMRRLRRRHPQRPHPYRCSVRVPSGGHTGGTPRAPAVRSRRRRPRSAIFLASYSENRPVADAVRDIIRRHFHLRPPAASRL
jgi:hypothetical protein